MKEINKSIGENVWNRRIELGLTRDELSEKSDISTKYLYEIENGKKEMSVGIFIRLAKSLNTDCNSLVYGKSDENKFAYIENILSELSGDELMHAERILYHYSKACAK